MDDKEPHLETDLIAGEPLSTTDCKAAPSHPDSAPEPTCPVEQTELAFDELAVAAPVAASKDEELPLRQEPVSAATQVQPIVATQEESVVATQAEPVTTTHVESVVASPAEPIATTQEEPAALTQTESVVPVKPEPVEAQQTPHITQPDIAADHEPTTQIGTSILFHLVAQARNAKDPATDYQLPPPPSQIRRKVVKAVFGGGIAAALGHGLHPWIAGDKQKDTIATARRLVKRVYEGPGRMVARDEYESTVEPPITPDFDYRPAIPLHLDPYGREYEAFLLSLGLRYIKPSELLRPHFNIRGAVSNSLPPKELWRNMTPTLKVADELRQLLGVRLETIASAYRSPAYNAACAGAASHSYHMQNRALDLVYDCSPQQVAEAARSLRNQGIFRGGIGRYPGFTHIDTRGKNADWG